MKVFKDRFVEWLDEEIDKRKKSPYTSHAHVQMDVLLSVKENLNRIIREEYEKIKSSNEKL